MFIRIVVLDTSRLMWCAVGWGVWELVLQTSLNLTNKKSNAQESWINFEDCCSEEPVYRRILWGSKIGDNEGATDLNIACIFSFFILGIEISDRNHLDFLF